ncbi:MAG: glycosyltransferase family 87 protein [Candidatus Omnitrophica bacterium]|nr:glycosyltransferase family 87 protein [Candidatus Omnitrophota bacterium]
MLILYTAAHFFYSGIYSAVFTGSPGQIIQQIAPLEKFLQSGEFVIDNPRQYGPFFILLISPFMFFYSNKFIFSIALLIFSYFLVIFAFYFCFRSVFRSGKDIQRKVSFWMLLFLWLNFSPLLYILNVRNVEIWELFLICLGFFTYINRKYFAAGFSFAAATLTKMLPAIFIFYFFFKNKKVFYYSIFGLLSIMVLSNLIFGSQIGLLYLPFLLSRPFGSRTWCVTHFENVSLKGFIYKLFGGFRENNYFFLISPGAEKIAFIAITVVQIIVIYWLIRMALEKKTSGEDAMIQFSFVSIIMIAMSPMSAFEYSTLLLLAYSAGLYFVLFKNIPRYLYLIFGFSYFLVGNFLPLNLIVKLFPFRKINQILGNNGLDAAESYKAYCIPLIGIVLLGIFFINLWKNRELYKEQAG